MYPSPIGVKLPGFYVYWWEYFDSAGINRDCAVCFKAPGEIQATAWMDLIEEVSKGPELPDTVLIIYLKQDATHFEKGRDDLNVRISLARFEKRFPCYQVAICLADGSVTIADVGEPSAISRESNLNALDPRKLKEILQVGLQRIFAADHVIVAAPPGFEFIRHGGNIQKRSNVFLRAEQALTDTAVVSFVAICIWLRLLDSYQGRVPKIDSIYVDTMGISPVAFALREFFTFAGTGRLPQIESFHSYGGMDNVRVPNKAQTLCLISASTSMNMHRSWVRSKGVEAHQVTVLVTQSGCEGEQYALVRLDDRRLIETDASYSATAPYSIRIRGETFVPDLEGAKSVLIGLKHSLLDRDSKYQVGARQQFSIYNSLGLLVHGSAIDSNPTYKPIFVDGSKAINSDLIKTGLLDAIDQFGFAKARWIIYAGDADSKELAITFAEHLSLESNRVIPADQVATMSSTEFGQFPILIAGAVVGQGSQFIGISRDLRGRHKGNRLYLAGVHIPTTFAAKDMLARNLEKSKLGEGIYKFWTFCSLPCGSGGAASFIAEKRLLDRFPDVEWPSPILDRFELLNLRRTNSPLFGLMPTGSDLSSSLELREGFTFWGPGYQAGAWTSAVLWTIGATLQRAREDVTLPTELQLRSTALTQVFLDPENFTRYNDGIVQGALLRMALDHELDYRGQPEPSNRMRRFLVRMFRNITDINSEALLEFLIALATERLRLETEDLKKFVDESSIHLASQPDSNMKLAAVLLLRALRSVARIGSPDQQLPLREF